MYIGVDFDGTCVTHNYPEMGNDIGAVPVLKKIVDNKHKLILITMRGNDNVMSDALNWFKDNNIPLYGINNNPTQRHWTKSTKAYAQLYIDDSALGCPLKFDETLSDRHFVDWIKVEEMLINLGVIF